MVYNLVLEQRVNKSKYFLIIIEKIFLLRSTVYTGLRQVMVYLQNKCKQILNLLKEEKQQ